MTMEQAVHRLTGDQADWFGVDAGKIREGDRADVVVIDPAGFNQDLDNRNAGKATDYWSLTLPTETRHYVPKLIALAKIFDDPKAYGIDLPPLKDEPYFEVVDTGSQLDLAQAAELAGVDIDEIYLLNPSYNRWATNPDGPHRLLVPKQQAEAFQTALAEFPSEQRVSWQNYKVRKGDSLNTIARKFSTTPSVIQQVNKLNSDLIRIGQQLLIPSSTKGSDAYALSQAQRLVALWRPSMMPFRPVVVWLPQRRSRFG